MQEVERLASQSQASQNVSKMIKEKSEIDFCKPQIWHTVLFMFQYMLDFFFPAIVTRDWSSEQFSFFIMTEEICRFKGCFFCKLSYKLNTYTDFMLPFCGHHFRSRLLLDEAIFLALAQEDDVPILNTTYKALISLWLIVSPTGQTAVKVHNTRLLWITRKNQRCVLWFISPETGNQILAK